MSQVTLKDIYDRFDRFEDKLDKRFEKIETRTEVLETFTNNLKGKLAVFLFLINLIFIFIIEAAKDKFNIRL